MDFTKPDKICMPFFRFVLDQYEIQKKKYKFKKRNMNLKKKAYKSSNRGENRVSYNFFEARYHD